VESDIDIEMATLEQVTRWAIESGEGSPIWRPLFAAWETAVLPLNYAREGFESQTILSSFGEAIPTVGTVRGSHRAPSVSSVQDADLRGEFDRGYA